MKIYGFLLMLPFIIGVIAYFILAFRAMGAKQFFIMVAIIGGTWLLTFAFAKGLILFTK